MSGGEMSGGEMSWGEMSGDEMSGGEMSWGEVPTAKYMDKKSLPVVKLIKMTSHSMYYGNRK